MSLESFHDDILINILIRIPPERVIKCRMVCKRWRNLTSDPDFIDSHFKMAKPSIIAQFSGRNGRLCFLGNNVATKRKLSVTPICRDLMCLNSFKNRKNLRVSIEYSSDGLIVYSTSSGLFVCNPITHEDFALPNSKESYLCGLFFHTLIKEHRLLYLQDEGDHYGYKIFSLETNSWRDLSCISYDQPKFSLSTYNGRLFPVESYFDFGPITANGSLYWIVLEGYDSCKRPRRVGNVCENLILRFDMNSEVIDTIPHPEHANCSGRERDHEMELVEVEEKLGILQMQIEPPKVINIWILVDPGKKHWVRKYKIDLQGYDKYRPSGYGFRISIIRIVGISEGDLLLHWDSKGFFRHNLQTGTIFKIGIEGSRKMKTDDIEYVYPLVYKKSLRSIKPCTEVFKGTK